MILTLVSFFDKDLKSYSTLQAINCPSWKDLKVDFNRGIRKQFPLDKLGQFAGKVLFFKGYFDDETGILTPAEDIEANLLDLDSLLELRVEYVKSIQKSKALLDEKSNETL